MKKCKFEHFWNKYIFSKKNCKKSVVYKKKSNFFFQKCSNLHERCGMCWNEWKINFTILIFRVIVKNSYGLKDSWGYGLHILSWQKPMNTQMKWFGCIRYCTLVASVQCMSRREALREMACLHTCKLTPIYAARCVQHLLSERLRLSA